MILKKNISDCDLSYMNMVSKRIKYQEKRKVKW